MPSNKCINGSKELEQFKSGEVDTEKGKFAFAAAKAIAMKAIVTKAIAAVAVTAMAITTLPGAAVHAAENAAAQPVAVAPAPAGETSATQAAAQLDPAPAAQTVPAAALPDPTFVGVEDHGIPIMKLYLNGVTLDVVNTGSKDTKYQGNVLQIIDNGQVTEQQADVEFKGRGNSTWRESKKPYQIRFADKTDLFGLGASRKWVLLANSLDPTGIHNDFAKKVANDIAEPYVAQGTFVDLYVNNEYVGAYYLTHKTELGSAVVDLDSDAGLLLQINNFNQDYDDPYFISNGGTFVNVSDSEDEANVQANMHLVEQQFNQFEADIAAGNWEGVQKEIDVTSFARYYLLNELGNNPDANDTSFYLYWDGPGDLIHAGPIWDFDVAFGTNPFDDNFGNDPGKLAVYRKGTKYPLTLLIDTFPQFREIVNREYRENIRPAAATELSRMDSLAAKIRTAQNADHAKWHYRDFDRSIEEMKAWIFTHMTVMDAVYYAGGDPYQYQGWVPDGQ